MGLHGYTCLYVTHAPPQQCRTLLGFNRHVNHSLTGPRLNISLLLVLVPALVAYQILLRARAAVSKMWRLDCKLSKGSQHKSQEVGPPPWNRTTYLTLSPALYLCSTLFVFLAFQRTAGVGYEIRFGLNGD